MLGKKVCLISKFDYCGSGYRMKEAVNLTSNNDVTYIVVFPTEWHAYFKATPPMTFSLQPNKFSYTESTASKIQMILDDADIYHFKGDDPPAPDFIPGCKINMSKPVITTISGSMARRKTGENFKDIEDSAKELYSAEDYNKYTDIMTAMNPDLNYPDLNGMYVPFAFDTNKSEYTWKRKDKIIISHSPSDMAKKGTKYVISAFANLKRLGYNVELDVISGVPHEECVERRNRSTIFVEQNRYGCYSNSSVEAMASGIPTLAYLPDNTLKQAQGRLDDCPVVNCGTTVEEMTDALCKVINSNMPELSVRTREWCVKEHSYENVGELWADIYEKASK